MTVCRTRSGQRASSRITGAIFSASGRVPTMDTTRSTASLQECLYGLNGTPCLPPSNPHRDENYDDLGGWGTGWAAQYQFGSAHPAGMNAVFADGSVHNVKYGIDPQVFNALGNINDGTNFASSPDDY